MWTGSWTMRDGTPPAFIAAVANGFDANAQCEECLHDEHYLIWYCTREADHEGFHVAHAEDVPVVAWLYNT